MHKVLFAKFHQTLHFPGVGELGNTLPPSNKALENLVMETNANDSLLVKFSFKGLSKSFLIPSANVAGMDLVVETKPVIVKKTV